MLGTHAVKVKGPGDKRWDFLGTGGVQTHLRVHALTMSEADAEKQAAYVAEHNDGVQVKVVKL